MESDGERDLPGLRGRRRQGPTMGMRPGAGAAGSRRRVVKRYAGRLPVSGTEESAMFALAHEKWSCECGRSNFSTSARCSRCGGGRPW